jgi:hypothetical protein
LKQEYSRFDGLDKCQDQIEKAEALYQKTCTVEKALACYEEFKRKIQSKKAEIQRWSGLEGILVPESVLFQELLQDFLSLSELLSLQNRRKEVFNQISKLTGIEGVSVPEASFVSDSLESLSVVQILQDLRNRYAKIVGLAEKLSQVEKLNLVGESELQKVQNIISKLDFWKSLSEQVVRYSKMLKEFELLESLRIPDCTGVLELSDNFSKVIPLQSRYSETVQNILSMETELDGLGTQASSLDTEISNRLGDWGSCPACGTLFSCVH